MKYYYPAIFEPKSNGVGFVLTIPDIQGCYTQGDDMENSMWMAHEAIGCMLEEVDEKDYPAPSDIRDINLENYPSGSFIKMVVFDKEKYDRDTILEENNQNLNYLEGALA